MARATLRLLGLSLLLFSCGASEDTGTATPDTGAQQPAAAQTTATAPAAASALDPLRAELGKYPRDVQLFEREPLHGRLAALLGDRYATFVANMGTQGPLTSDGSVLYVIGNKPHAGGDSAAILLVDLAQDLIHVHLLDRDEMAELRERDAEVAWPADVQVTIANWHELAREE